MTTFGFSGIEQNFRGQNARADFQMKKDPCRSSDLQTIQISDIRLAKYVALNLARANSDVLVFIHSMVY